MSTLIITAISLAISVGLMFGGLTFLKKKSGAGADTGRKDLEEQIALASKTLEDLAGKRGNFVSKGQFDFLVSGIETQGAELVKEKERLKEIEAKLDTAQKQVEEKEGHQQELKSAKEEDEMRLAELAEKFDSLSSESIGLEQRLASSLKSLDSMIETVQLTDNQKAALSELSGALSSAGERLRDLVTEYQNLNERLNMLKSQHEDLEIEYTKLVEQQLGE